MSGNGISDFFRTNFFGLLNLLALICGLAYFSGQLQSSVGQQNAAIADMERQLRRVQSLQGETGQNTSDISRIRGNQDAERHQLDRISEQISALSQWVKDHRGGLGAAAGGGP